MIFTQYSNIKDFSDDVLETLNHHEIQNNLLLLNIKDGSSSNKLMATVKDDDGHLLLTAIRTLPFPMVMYETDNIRNDAAVAFFASSLLDHNIDVDYIMTEKELAKSFCEKYSKLSGKNYHNNISMVLYVLEKVNKLELVKGLFRKSDKNDLFYLPYWYADFEPACNLGEYNLTNGTEEANKSVEENSAYLWVDSYPVSLASTTRKTSNCAFITHVYTPPNFRGKGYGTACVSNLSQKLLDDGFKYCALYADCANPYSNRVYQKIGYKQVFWYDQYKF